MTDGHICRDCQKASFVLRRIGFRDNISWGKFKDSPNDTIHASHANSGNKVIRPETDDEYKRRMSSPSGTRLPFGQLITEFVREPLCSNYRSELAWITASSPTRPTIYVGHPLSGNFEKNVKVASDWVKFLRRLSIQQISSILNLDYNHRPIITAPWLAAVEEDGFHPGGREGALADCRDIVAMFDEFWMVGGFISGGMREEMGSARIIRDLTFLGPTPPTLGGN
jgi:hypothetical protein